MVLIARLLLLLVVPALAVPRGVMLDWCLCGNDQEADCCSTCCGEDLDCEWCKSIEVDDFDELLPKPPSQVPAPTVTIVPWGDVSAVRTVFLETRATRGPPERLTPLARFPGARPLRS